MPARVKKIRHDDETRSKIQAAQIINRLHTHIMAEAPIMDSSQVSAAKVLLNKVLPDLQSVTVDADVRLSQEDALRELE